MLTYFYSTCPLCFGFAAAFLPSCPLCWFLDLSLISAAHINQHINAEDRYQYINGESGRDTLKDVKTKVH